ncbi:YbgC/FadM family acyl-CoA thioesterase [Sulfurimonas sp.]|uniref:YbgC/FadM family acyl-CoA thioesterase n=1 Tax=Sulfurimonas sp. TaxID=2022749 RepID=UPI0025E09273|nr:YbgC/FadM family acyl-CoA thioesterase [Sulfurimonas sp.]MDD5156846.1 YbgC/FadM family acyl-CoA thioesterase [Sulfurimonas sp.]
MQIRVYYEDTDVGGVVYHSNYLNFCERARSDIFFKKGLNPILESGHFVAKKLEANYISSAKFGDELEVATVLKEMRNASFELLQVVLKDNKKIFELKIVLAYVSHEAKPQKITSGVKEMLLNLFDV